LQEAVIKKQFEQKKFTIPKGGLIKKEDAEAVLRETIQRDSAYADFYTHHLSCI
jgi:predicted rRNA methylase YqxC with S4 and FtsJ domains